MGPKIAIYVTVVCVMLGALAAQARARFSCSGRTAGYYADMDTGCQVYHMCDGLGRQFSYSCPNTTLFQQRMLVCDHWYMVNCSNSERDYFANKLIGQRDKPFITDEEMLHHTPRPDILSVPSNSNYYEGLKEAESKYSLHGNSIVGAVDSISGGGELDADKQYRPPAAWSTARPATRPPPATATAATRPSRPAPTPRPTTPVNPGYTLSQELQPPRRPTPPPTTTESEDYSLDIRMKEDPVVDFINRFDPDGPAAHRTAMSRSEILDLNRHLPQGQDSAEREDARTPKKINNGNVNSLQTDKGVAEQSRFATANTKIESPKKIQPPDQNLLPPKTEYSEQPSTTMGPPVYYQWKWAVPAFDLKPPTETNITQNVTIDAAETHVNRSPFRSVTRRPTAEPELRPSNVEYNSTSYYVPDYIFPLDKPHPGYETDDAKTSFQVGVPRPGRDSYGENPACPQCHPAYLRPGTCEPCIVKR